MSTLSHELQVCVSVRADITPQWPGGEVSQYLPRVFPLFVPSISSSLTPRQGLTFFWGGETEGSGVRVQPKCSLASNVSGLKSRAIQWVLLDHGAHLIVLEKLFYFSGSLILWLNLVMFILFRPPPSLNHPTLCFGFAEHDFNAVGYITLTKEGNKTWKYL